MEVMNHFQMMADLLNSFILFMLICVMHLPKLQTSPAEKKMPKLRNRIQNSGFDCRIPHG